MKIRNITSLTMPSPPPDSFFRPQLVDLTFGHRKRNQKKIRRLRRQGVKA